MHGEGHGTKLVRRLCRCPRETEWLEFRECNTHPEHIGIAISALANRAALSDQRVAYMAWGISDSDHSVVGTCFRPDGIRVEGKEFKPWLNHSLHPTPGLRFREIVVDGLAVVVLEVERAGHRPVAFKGTEYVRVGSLNRSLKDHPREEQRLWGMLDKPCFEEETALDALTTEDLWRLLDVEAYFNLLALSRPLNADINLEYLLRDRIIRPDAAGRWKVTNAGAMLFAKDLVRFPRLQGKRVRIIEYEGSSRLHARRELEFDRGYAAAFHEVVRFVMVLLPAQEVLIGALRRSTSLFPEVAIRELLTNMLVHQDFNISGAGPMVEIFEQRMEFTNPGTPLVDSHRLIDMPPRTRNDVLASLMRKFGICGEWGSGIDKVVQAMETHRLPAPRFDTPGLFTKVTLSGPVPWSDMPLDDRLRACYLHASRRYMDDLPVHNKSVRERFGFGAKDSARVSKLLGDAVASGLLCVRDPDAGYRTRTYVPWWAANQNGTADESC